MLVKLANSSSTVATLSAVHAVCGHPLPGTLSAVPYLSILQTSSQVLYMSNFSVEVLEETFVNCNLLAALNSYQLFVVCNKHHLKTVIITRLRNTTL